MATMLDYVRWRGDLLFCERPFNDVDNVILSALSYLDFSGIVPAPGMGSVRLADACDELLEVTGGNVTERLRSLAKFDGELLGLLAASARFRDVELSDYVDVFDDEKSLQFSALTAAFETSAGGVDAAGADAAGASAAGASANEAEGHAAYVSFRGTDQTIAGWHEDFMLSFTTTEAQRMATAYLEEVAGSTDGELLVGGHSKGGNLAVYAAMTCADEVRARIGRVWNNDGPGLAPELMQTSPHELLGATYARVVPAYDLVGAIFEREDDPLLVVESDALGVSQHDPFSWQVEGARMREAPALLPESELFRSAISSWLEGVSLAKREVVVNELFDALGAGGARTLDELGASSRRWQKVIAAFGDMDEGTKDALRSLMGQVLSEAFDATVKSMRVGARWLVHRDQLPHERMLAAVASKKAEASGRDVAGGR